MKCRTCGFPLWNLRQPRCPECGDAFNPMDWEFNEGSVRFLCPHCEEALDDMTQKSAWTLCPHCRRKLLWRAVIVEPLDTDPANAPLRSPPFGLSPWTGALILVMVAICAGVLMPATAGRPQPPDVGQYVLVFVIASLFCALGIGFAPRRRRRRAFAVYGVLLAAFTGIQVFSYVQQGRDYGFSRWWATTTMTLRNLGQVQRISLANTGGLPGTYAAFVHPDADLLVPADFYLTRDLGVTPGDLTVGPYMFQKIVDGEVTLAQLDAAMAADRSRTEWERIGDFVLSHNVQGLRAGDPELIVGISIASLHGGGHIVLFADGHCEGRSSTDPNWISDQNAYRAERGLEPLPSLP